jgi:hypothetical protein
MIKLKYHNGSRLYYELYKFKLVTLSVYVPWRQKIFLKQNTEK